MAPAPVMATAPGVTAAAPKASPLAMPHATLAAFQGINPGFGRQARGAHANGPHYLF
jgi:hypothetical protein